MIAPALGRSGLLGLGIQGVRVWGLGGQGFWVLGLEVHGLRFKGLGIFAFVVSCSWVGAVRLCG